MRKGFDGERSFESMLRGHEGCGGSQSAKQRERLDWADAMLRDRPGGGKGRDAAGRMQVAMCSVTSGQSDLGTGAFYVQRNGSIEYAAALR